MEKGFDREKNRISLFFVGPPDFPLPAVGRSEVLNAFMKHTILFATCKNISPTYSVRSLCTSQKLLMSVYHFPRRGEEQNREEGEMAQIKLGGGRNRGKK